MSKTFRRATKWYDEPDENSYRKREAKKYDSVNKRRKRTMKEMILNDLDKEDYS